MGKSSLALWSASINDWNAGRKSFSTSSDGFWNISLNRHMEDKSEWLMEPMQPLISSLYSFPSDTSCEWVTELNGYKKLIIQWVQKAYYSMGAKSLCRHSSGQHNIIMGPDCLPLLHPHPGSLLPQHHTKHNASRTCCLFWCHEHRLWSY